MLKPIKKRYDGIAEYFKKRGGKMEATNEPIHNELIRTVLSNMGKIGEVVKQDFVLNRNKELKSYCLHVLNVSKQRTKMLLEETEKDINEIVEHMGVGLYIPAVISATGNISPSNHKYTYVNEISFHHVSSMISALKIARFLGMTQDEQRDLAIGMGNHDISKYLMPEIVSKPGELNSEEEMIMRMHPEISYAILNASGYEIPERSLAITLYHHEKGDGSGYPNGLKSDQIPDIVKVAQVADIFDALTDPERPYRKRPFSLREAVGIIIKEGNQGKLEKQVTDALVTLNREGRTKPGETGYYQNGIPN